MSLIRQIWLLLVSTLALAFGGSLLVEIDAVRDTLQTQLRMKNAEGAQLLALAMSQQGGDLPSMEALLAAQFETGFYRSIRYTPIDGSTGFGREAQARPGRAPRWFIALAPIESQPGIAKVSDEWRAIGDVHVAGNVAHAHDRLYAVALRSAGLLALVGISTCIVGFGLVRSIRRPLDATVAQADALVEGRFESVAEPRVPELQRVVRAMNATVERVRTVFESQAGQVESLRQQAHNDPLTGLLNRVHFLSQLQSRVQHDGATTDGGLVLLRVRELSALNRSLGHQTVDRVLQAIAQVLDAYPQRTEGCFAGRLNGSDFALALPVPGIAKETAESLAQALRVALPAFGPRIGVAFGAVETPHGAELSALLGCADAALARAESGEAFCVQSAQLPQGPARKAGERAWRQMILDALEHGRAQLGSYPIVDRKGKVFALDAPLRLQLESGGPFEAAEHWLPWAVRTRLTSVVDEKAIRLALHAIASDAMPRTVNVSTASLADTGFVVHVRELLHEHAREAPGLWIDLAEAAAIDHFDRLREIGHQLRPLGVRLGLEHAGRRLAQIDRLYEAGLDYVKLDVAVVAGAASNAVRANHVAGIVTMLHGLSLRVVAEGVGDAMDVKALWDCGIDGVAGPWASAGEAAGEGGATED